MAYTADSFSAGEQPTTSKWNELWANDAALRDGSGFALNNNVIPANALATTAITLGYVETTSTQSTASTTPAAWTTGTTLTLTVTIPAGGRKIRVSAFCGSVGSSISSVGGSLQIWDGTVGSGTKITEGLASWTMASGTMAQHNIPVAISRVITPGAGSKTYNVGIVNNGAILSNCDFVASSTSPAYLLVEVI